MPNISLRYSTNQLVIAVVFSNLVANSTIDDGLTLLSKVKVGGSESKVRELFPSLFTAVLRCKPISGGKVIQLKCELKLVCWIHAH